MRGRHEAEDGVALFYALLVVLVVGGVIAVTLASATTELQQSAFELDFEDTVHVAEAGAELRLAELDDDNDDNTGILGPDYAGGQTAYEWAIDEATATDASSPCAPYALCAVDTGEGESVGIRPVGRDAEYVYGVGFTPSRDAFVNGDGDPYARVVRMQIGFASPIVTGQDAVRVDGNITINSNSYEIRGTNGSLHANGAMDVSKDNTDGGLSYSGSCPSTCLATGPVEAKPIPLLEIEDPWDTDEAKVLASEGAWYDYCAGQWYLRQEGDTMPCTGTPVSSPSGWSGLKLSAVADPDAVFWIDDPGTVEVDKVSGPVTVIARGDIFVGPSANIDAMVPKYPGLWLFTEGELDIGGNAEAASSAEPAIAYARGKLTLRGTMETSGIAYLAKDAELVGSGYKGGGNGVVRYDGGAQTNLGGDTPPLVLEWEEVRS